jgi:hypothetical protein
VAPAALGAQACGFQLVFEDAAAAQVAPAPATPGAPDGSGAEAADAPSPDPPTEAFAELPFDADLAPLRQALQLLAPPAPGAPQQPLPSPPCAAPPPCGERAAERPASGVLANGAAASSAAADSAQPRPRNTQARALGSARGGGKVPVALLSAPQSDGMQEQSACAQGVSAGAVKRSWRDRGAGAAAGAGERGRRRGGRLHLPALGGGRAGGGAGRAAPARTGLREHRTAPARVSGVWCIHVLARG